jgi:hypothetical protein
LGEEMSAPIIDVFALGNPYSNPKANDSDWSSTVFGFLRNAFSSKHQSQTNSVRMYDLTPADEDWTLLGDSKVDDV